MSMYRSLMMSQGGGGGGASALILSSLNAVDSALGTSYASTFTTNFDALDDDKKAAIDAADVASLCESIESEASQESANLSNGVSAYPNAIPTISGSQELLTRLVDDCGTYIPNFCKRLASYPTLSAYITGEKEPDTNYPLRLNGSYNTGLTLYNTRKVQVMFAVSALCNQTLLYNGNSGYSIYGGGFSLVGGGWDNANYYVNNANSTIKLEKSYKNVIAISTKGAINKVYSNPTTVKSTYTAGISSISASNLWMRQYSPNQGTYGNYYWLRVFMLSADSVADVTDADTETNRFIVIDSGLLYDVLNRRCQKT